MCNVIASWSNVMHEPPSLLVSYGFNAEPHAWPTPEFIAILSTATQHYCQETMSSQAEPLEVAGTLETRRPWRLLPAVVSSAWHGVGQELSFWQHVSLSLFGQMSHLSGSVIKRQMLRGPKSHVPASRLALVRWWPGASVSTKQILLVMTELCAMRLLVGQM